MRQPVFPSMSVTITGTFIFAGIASSVTSVTSMEAAGKGMDRVLARVR